MTSSPPRRTAPVSRPSAARPRRRLALAGFVTGFAAAFAVTGAALVSTVAERLHPVLVPAGALLRPLADDAAGWNGLVSMGLAGLVNGLVYAVLAVAAGAVFGGLAGPRRAGTTR